VISKHPVNKVLVASSKPNGDWEYREQKKEKSEHAFSQKCDGAKEGCKTSITKTRQGGIVPNSNPYRGLGGKEGKEEATIARG